MCGIAGWFRYPTQVDDETVYTVMSILFPKLMLEIEERGTDATGIYQVHEDSDWMLAKTGRRSSDWMSLENTKPEDDPISFNDFVQSWTQHKSPVKAVVGHCRKATVGTLGKKNEDNHPFSVQLDDKHAILGVHNGTLTNHERIFEKLSLLGSPLERQGTGDSESLFHLLYHASEGGTRPWTAADLYSVARRVDGSYALITMNSRFPDHVAVMRDDRPLEATYIAPIGVVVLCSEKRFVDRALGSYELLRRHSMIPLPALKAETQIIGERTCRIFDLTKEMPKVLKWGVLDELTVKADLNSTFHAFPEAEWRKPVVTTPATTTAPHYMSGVKTHTVTPPPPAASTPIAGAAPATAKTSKTPPAALVPVPVELPALTVDEEKTLEEARYIDLCPTFTTKAELAQILGTSAHAVDQANISLTSIDLLNRLCEIGFLQGYALSDLDSAREVERIRQAGRQQAERLENATTKWKKSQTVLWEMKILMLAYRYLEICKVPSSEFNIRVVLTRVAEISETRMVRILEVHQELSDSKILKTLKERLSAKEKPKAAGEAE